MITPAIIESLDRKNLSENATLSAVRFNEDFSASTAEQKNQIAELSMRKKTTFYKIKSDGIITARLLVATSFILNVSPYWYTGQDKNKETCSYRIMKKFFREHNYKKALEILEKTAIEAHENRKHSYSQQAKKSTMIDNTNTRQVAYELLREALFDNDFLLDAVNNLTFEEAAKILETLFILAKCSPRHADYLTEVKTILLKGI